MPLAPGSAGLGPQICQALKSIPFPLAHRVGEGWGRGVSHGPPPKGMKDGLTKKAEKAGFIFIRYDEANRSGGDFYGRGSWLLTVPKRRQWATSCRASWGDTRISQRQKWWRQTLVRALIVVSREGTGEAGEAGLGLASLNNFGGLWG